MMMMRNGIIWVLVLYEGAVKEDGRGPTVWDKFSHSFGKIIDFSNADFAVDQYHRYNEDIQLMKDMGMDAYRFSIAWSRIFPSKVNNMAPSGYHLMLFGLNQYRTPLMILKQHKELKIFSLAVYVNGDKACFNFLARAFYGVNPIDTKLGDKGPTLIALWIFFQLAPLLTLGLPFFLEDPLLHTFRLPPFLVKGSYKKLYDFFYNASGKILDEGEKMGIQREEVCHNLLFATCFNSYGGMEILFPSLLKFIGQAGVKLHKQLAEEIRMVVQSNGGTVTMSGMEQMELMKSVVYETLRIDSLVPLQYGKAKKDLAASAWLYIFPEGIRSLMNYIKQKYGNPLVIITENGMDDPNSPFISIEDALQDKKRIKYHSSYLSNLLASIKEDGCNVRGYFAWSLLDNWEWAAGYTSRFGLYFVDYKDNLKRYPKQSVQWFKNFLTS
ncbi:hypothetical protein NE237_020145 [Protea cynaroides]|uniref:Beta-glucosidase n=1 Tax=Protea cynaroides TaxID=273540 RepID=A0A9Q0H8V1_9MAGN|nr:hypothetical protein NE237_020145 [Protea cynaroides]